MPDADRLTPATPEDLADALAFALRYSGRKRTHDAGEMMAEIEAKRLVEHSRFYSAMRPGSKTTAGRTSATGGR